MQWNSTVLVAKYLSEGSEEEKDRMITERIKKFHLYNTKELKKHHTAQRRVGVVNSGTVTDSLRVGGKESEKDWEKSLILLDVVSGDLNYLRTLFKELEISVERVISLSEEKTIQFYFKEPF